MINLRETERLKKLLETSPDRAAEITETAAHNIGICITDAQGIFRYVNDNYCKIYGYSREELVNGPFVVVVPEDFREQMQFLHDKFIKDRKEIVRQWTVQRKGGALMEITVDAAYNDKVLAGGPHKVTFVHREDI